MKLQQFYPNTIPPEAVCVFVGPRGSGKSVAMSNVLYHKRKYFSAGIVMSATEDGNNFWAQFVNKNFIYTEFRPVELKHLYEAQKDRVKTWTKKNPPNIFCVAEDVIYDRALRQDPTIRQIFFNGRHFNWFMMMSIQYAKSIPPEYRTNINILFVFGEDSHIERRKLYESFFGFIDTYQQFSDILNEITQDYGVLVLDRTVKSNRPEERLFRWKAEPQVRFRAGDQKFQRYGGT
jgi:Poxvirus A32 protein